MTSVHHAAYELLRSLEMDTFFGNPGSYELTFLDDFPSDFRYVLALQEGAGLAMADAYAQSTGGPVPVSLHAAAGVGRRLRRRGTPSGMFGGKLARMTGEPGGHCDDLAAVTSSRR